MKTKRELIALLAKGVQEKYNPISYGRLRRKLHGNNFCEIAIYSKVVEHLEEKNIEVESYIDSMSKLIEGLADSPLYPRKEREFHYLSGSMNEISNASDANAVQSATQQGKFLCNKCFEIKGSEHRGKGKTGQNTCKGCKTRLAQSNYSRKAKVKTENMSKETMKNEEEILTSEEEQERALVIQEIIGDSETTSVSITIPTKNLHKLLSSLQI